MNEVTEKKKYEVSVNVFETDAGQGISNIKQEM